MITSKRLDDVPNVYMENIYDDDRLIAYLFSYHDDGTKYVYHDNINQHYIKGFDTVADAKECFFKLYNVS